MAEIDNKKPEEAPKSKPQPHPDDSLSHALTVFAQSLAYTAIEGPSRGAAQLVDHTFGSKIDDTVQTKLNNIGIHQPEAAHYGTHAWTAEQMGNGIGMVVPMWLARKAMVGKAEQTLVRTASVEGSIVASLKQPSLAGNALREAKLSARTGFFYGALLTPTDDKNSSGNIVVDRLKQGFNSGVTFAGMGYTSSLSSGLLGRAAVSLESTALPSVFKSHLQTALHSSFVHGAIGGVPGGLIQAQLGALESGKPVASLQDFKENVISMTMVGGTMGSAGLFKEAPPPLADNLAALRRDSISHSTSHADSHSDSHSSPPEPTTEKLPKSTPEIAKPANPFDIKFDQIDRAWQPAEVKKYMTQDTRAIDFIPKGREQHVANADWTKFSEWGIESKKVPVEVYRFPGLKAEIIVPSDYARILDQVRQQRLNPSGTADGAQLLATHGNRILPEELAQMLKQLPNPDIVKTAELLDHASPQDLQKNHVKSEAAKLKGETLDPKKMSYTIADATTPGVGRLRFYESATNSPKEMQWLTSHEWAHLVEENVAFKAFAQALEVEDKGYVKRAYALENHHENWAVHFGEQLLSPDGEHFAQLPEKAPARTLVMAKALRNMLEARSDNPTPKHVEFLARTQAAEEIATRRLQAGILADLAKGDQTELDKKLKFLNIAATSAESPELLSRVISPIDKELLPVLEARSKNDSVANEILANRQASRLIEKYSPEAISAFADRWKALKNGETQTRLFNSLPEQGQHAVLSELERSPAGSTNELFMRLNDATSGKTQKLVIDSLHNAETRFEKEGLKLFRAKEPVPVEYLDWLARAENPQARLAALQNQPAFVTNHWFTNLIHGLQPAEISQMVLGDAMAYVVPEQKLATWTSVLNRLPQGDQVKLFRELGNRHHDPAFLKMADHVEKMSDTTFGDSWDKIHYESLKVLSARENSAAFIASHLNTIKDTPSFLKAASVLDYDQMNKVLDAGALGRFPPAELDKFVTDVSRKFTTRFQVDILGAIDPARPSIDRINLLTTLSASKDPIVSGKAERLVVDVASKQLASLKEKVDDAKAQNAAYYLEQALLRSDNAKARLVYLQAHPLDSTELSNYDRAIMAVGAGKLSSTQTILLLRGGLTDRLTPNYRTQLLEGVYRNNPQRVRDQLQIMGDFSGNSSSISNEPGRQPHAEFTRVAQLAPNKTNGIILDSLPLEAAKPAHPYDIKFDRIDVAWAPGKVNKYMSVETRPISFAREGHESRIGHEDWSDFENWGMESREVKVNVYRFPGVEAEIVVPSDYAQILDQVRQKRLNYYDPDSFAEPVDGISVVPYDKRILPEEVAQLLQQLPHPGVVTSVELLDHANPWNPKHSHDEQVQAQENGAEPPERDFVALADADIQGSGRMRFFNSSSNHQEQLQDTVNHEWAHLIQMDKAFLAFDHAADTEKNGFYARDYARKNEYENWAVHLGEQFLGRDGAGFAELPEKAPARTLVMAKALRNMLEQRKDNPSPKHEEFLNRVEAAEAVATSRLQASIRADIAKGDDQALDDKLHFLNIAASRAKSSETLQKVLAPLDSELLPFLVARGSGDSQANEVIANRVGAWLEESYSPDLMPEFSRRWRGVTDSAAQTELFGRLPDQAKALLLQDLATNPVENTRSLLNRLIEDNYGRNKKLFKDMLEMAQTNFEEEGLALYRSGKAIPKPYVQWLENSDIHEARLAALKNRDSLASTHNFDDLTKEFEPRALREFIVGDGMAYVDRDSKYSVWDEVLRRLPQEEQVKLFRELGREHDPAYRKIATRINKMGANEFEAEFWNIRNDSIKILTDREKNPEYIKANPDRIRDARAFLNVTEKLGKEPTIDLIKAGALDRLTGDEVDEIIERTSQRFDAGAQVDILGAIKPDHESLARINMLTKLSLDDDPVVAAKAQSLLIDVSNDQLTLLHPQTLEYLRSGITDLLTPAEKTKFLQGISLDASPEIIAQLKSMGLKEPRRRRANLAH